jgi:tetratricopeptide (TPR) repeat protein
MPDSRPEQLIRAEELTWNGKVEEAFEMVINFEKTSELTQKDQLSALLLKGQIYIYTLQIKKGVEVGERAYSMSQELELVPESIEALYLKTWIGILGKIDEAFKFILEAEKLLNSLPDESSANISHVENLLNLTKSWIYFYKSDLNKALDLGLTLGEKNFLDTGYKLSLIAHIYVSKGEHDTALEYGMDGLKTFETLDFQVGIARMLYIIGNIYYFKGELNRALEFIEKSLLIEKVSDLTKVQSLSTLSGIYHSKGELNKALKYMQQSTKLAEEISHYLILIINKSSIGEIYRTKGENEKAIKYFKQSLALSEKIGNKSWVVPPLLYLLLSNLEHNSPEQAQHYLKRLESLSNQHKSSVMKQGYLLGKALMLKRSLRMRDKGKAEELLKQIVEDEIIWPQFHIIAIISLCGLLLEELSIYNSPETINEINPLIIKLKRVAENQHSFSKLAEGKLLQAKLALIKMNLDEAKLFFNEAQKIADLHGLNLLAQKISHEYDILLEKFDEWEKLKQKDTPMADRINLASIDGVIDRMQGKLTINPPEFINEEPILLLIMDNSGATYFNHAFAENWDYSDLFSSFMSAFNTFIDEIFSNSIDRIKVKENTILINPVEKFLVCYVIKGQSYPALQKLSRFSETIRKNSEIWQALNKSVKTSEMLELDKPPVLKTVIDEIFTR